MSKNEITIVVGGKKREIPYASFAKIVRGALQSIGRTARYMGVPGKNVRWGIVDAKKTNPVEMKFSLGDAEIDFDLMSDWIDSIGALERNALRPSRLPINALDFRKEISECLSDGVAFIEFSAADKKTRVSNKFVSHANEVADTAAKEAQFKPTSIKESASGVLHDIITHNESKVQFKLKDRVTNRYTDCEFKSNAVFNDAKECLKRRVTITGIFHRDDKGVVVKIEVDKIEPFPDVGGIDYLGFNPLHLADERLDSMDSADIIREMRED